MDSDLPIDSDTDNLRQFTDRRDEAAFVRLVDRHAPMVRGVALRCTGDAALADEVTQSVFFLLACKAASVPKDHLGGWLHRTTFLTARNARRKSLRYKQALRELSQQPDAMTASSIPDPQSQSAPWEEVHPRLDDAVARLPERARQPVILRFFENRSIRDIASLTGKSEAAVRKALERSLQRLSVILRHQGVTTSGSALAAMLSANSLLAPPASAAVVAAGALSASHLATAAIGPALLHGPIRLLGSHPFLQGAAAALLLTAVPLAILWRQNTGLKQTAATVLERPVPVAPAPRQDPSAAAPPIAPSPPPIGLSQEKTPPARDQISSSAIKEKSKTDAARELARINLYLPDLTADQQARILQLYQERTIQRTAAFEQARQSGAFTRLAGGIPSLTPQDIALFNAAHSAPGDSPADADALRQILTPEQFSLHSEATERRRINHAEGVASDTLRSLGQNFDLTTEQKDAIFQAVAHFELHPSEETEGAAATLPSPFREEGRNRAIRSLLSDKQAILFDQRQEDDRRRREQFLQTMQPPR